MVVPDKVMHLFSERFRQAAADEEFKHCHGLRIVMECSHLLLLSNEFLNSDAGESDLPERFKHNGRIMPAGKLFSLGYGEHGTLVETVTRAKGIVMLYEFDGQHFSLTMKCDVGGSSSPVMSTVRVMVKPDGRTPGLDFVPDQAIRT